MEISQESSIFLYSSSFSDTEFYSKSFLLIELKTKQKKNKLSLTISKAINVLAVDIVLRLGVVVVVGRVLQR